MLWQYVPMYVMLIKQFEFEFEFEFVCVCERERESICLNYVCFTELMVWINPLIAVSLKTRLLEGYCKCMYPLGIAFLMPPEWRLHRLGPSIAASNQIKSLLLSHHHSTSALVSEILTSVLQTVQKKKTTTIYIWTVHIYRLYQKTKYAKYTYIYSRHTSLPMDQYTLYTVFTRLHYVHIYT